MSEVKNLTGDAKALLKQLKEAIAECERLHKENCELRMRLDKEVKLSARRKHN